MQTFVRHRADIRISDHENAVAALKANKELGTSELFFLSGRMALSFALRIISDELGRPCHVGVQAFTCESVFRSIADARCVAVPFDVNPTSISIRISDSQYSSIDVLLISHLFGVGDPTYESLVHESRKRSILVIDDVTQTFGAFRKESNLELGSLADLAIYSFGYDKPVTALHGGSLRINSHCPLNIQKRILCEYSNLETESPGSATETLTTLFLIHESQCPSHAAFGCQRDGPLIRMLSRFPKNPFFEVTHATLNSSLTQSLNSLLSKLHRPKAVPLKMHPLRVHFVESQRARFRGIRDKRHVIRELLNEALLKSREKIQELPVPPDLEPSWVRWTGLAENRDILVERLRKGGIEAGCFNWNRLPSTTLNTTDFPNAYALTKRIVNIPIWAPSIVDAASNSLS